MHYILCTLFLSGIISTVENDINDHIKDYLASLPDSVIVTIKAEWYDGGLIFEHNGEKQVPSASLIKVPILIELLRAIEQNEMNWHEEYILQEQDKVGGAGTIAQQLSGSSFSIEELATEMIRVSDNTATNILIRKIGMDRVNAFIKSNNLNQTVLQREMMDFKAIEEGRQNYTAATDINSLFRLLLDGQLLNKKWTKKAIQLLEGCSDRSTIPKMLPSNIRIAHKTGTLNYFRGDAGIIFTDYSPMILSIFVERFESISQAEEIIGTLAKLIFESKSN